MLSKKKHKKLNTEKPTFEHKKNTYTHRCRMTEKLESYEPVIYISCNDGIVDFNNIRK